MKPPLLMLAHRLPYPPNKGEKLRAFHLLRHLARDHRVFLGCFIDDPEDFRHVAPLRKLCEEVCALRIRPAVSRVSSLVALATGQSLTERYFHRAALDRWVDAVIAREGISRALVFCSAMAPYVNDRAGLVRWVDFVDVDSAKWAQYASQRPHSPAGWLYRREARRVSQLERASAARAQASFFVTDAERALFLAGAPGLADQVHVLGNGVDAAYFSPQRDYANPFASGEPALVMTGVMNYPPNEDAACWFAQAVLPRVLAAAPSARFHVVGMRPSARVRALAGGRVSVTGAVPDIRPYLAHAAVAVAPLRLARGIQNKVLEAMAMARAVVARPECGTAIDATDGAHFFIAREAADFADRVVALLRAPEHAKQVGGAARERIETRYSWTAALAALDQWVRPCA